MPYDNVNFDVKTVQQHANKQRVNKIQNISSKKKKVMRMTGGAIMFLVTVAIVFDMLQMFVGISDALSAIIGSKTQSILDFVASLTKYIPYFGTVVYSGYQAVKLSVVIFIWLIKIFISLVILMLSKIVFYITYKKLGISWAERHGLSLESKKIPSIMMLNFLIFPIYFFEIFIPIWPGITISTLLTIYTAKQVDKMRIKKHAEI